jgi:hypothetical protein
MLALFTGLMSATALVSIATPLTLPSIVERVEPQEAELTSTSSIRSYIEAEAVKVGVDKNLAVMIAECESGFVPQQSQIVNAKGERENSWGVWQIHLPDHPQVTREQAMDIKFSTEYSLDLLKKGQATLWSCYKNK